MTPPIIWISGPPAAGKTTLSEELMTRFPRAVHLQVDQLRNWVVSGMADSVPWTDETERQFQIAEEATCDVALRYQASGFAVVVDHCRNLPRVQALVDARLQGVPVIKVCLLPDLDTNLERNHQRTDKPFEPSTLDPIIHFMSGRLGQDVPRGWQVLDNSRLTPEQTADSVLNG